MFFRYQEYIIEILLIVECAVVFLSAHIQSTIMPCVLWVKLERLNISSFMFLRPSRHIYHSTVCHLCKQQDSDGGHLLCSCWTSLLLRQQRWSVICNWVFGGEDVPLKWQMWIAVKLYVHVCVMEVEKWSEQRKKPHRRQRVWTGEENSRGL